MPNQPPRPQGRGTGRSHVNVLHKSSISESLKALIPMISTMFSPKTFIHACSGVARVTVVAFDLVSSNRRMATSSPRIKRPSGRSGLFDLCFVAFPIQNISFLPDSTDRDLPNTGAKTSIQQHSIARQKLLMMSNRLPSYDQIDSSLKVIGCYGFKNQNERYSRHHIRELLLDNLETINGCVLLS